MNKQLIQDIEDKIQYLKDLKKELETDKSNYFIDFYETEYIEEPLDYVYIPQIKRQEGSKNDSVCTKCSGKGFIQERMDKDVHYRVCPCRKRSYEYKPEKVSVTAIVEEKYYLIIHNEEVFRIPYKSVRESFDEKDINENTETLFYIHKEDCEHLCTLLNKEFNKYDK
jgi:hypothetical protein